MIIQFKEVKDLFDEFNEVVADAERFTIFTRDIELQKEARNSLDNFIEKSQKIKKANTDKFSEPELNLILCLIFSAEALISELSI